MKIKFSSLKKGFLFKKRNIIPVLTAPGISMNDEIYKPTTTPITAVSDRKVYSE